MKFLKLFESFDKLYNHISEEKFNDNETRTNLDFDLKLTQMIKSQLNFDYILKVRNLDNDGVVHLDINHYDMNSNWEIWQTSDDWFMVHALYNIDGNDHVGPGEEYFECDTFDGLIQLLKDHDVI